MTDMKHKPDQVFSLITWLKAFCGTQNRTLMQTVMLVLRFITIQRIF